MNFVNNDVTLFLSFRYKFDEIVMEPYNSEWWSGPLTRYVSGEFFLIGFSSCLKPQLQTKLSKKLRFICD